MLGPNFMGLYQPQAAAGGPPAAPTLNPVFSGGLYQATHGTPAMVQQQQPPAPAPTDPWAAMQPKLDAYMQDWLARQQSRAGSTPGDSNQGEGNPSALQGGFTSNVDLQG